MDFNQIIRDIKNKIYQPVYVLCGEEEFYIDAISDLLEESVLNQSEKEFNQTVLYGAETDVLTVEAEAKRYPMMASYNLVIVKEAQNLRKLEKLSTYVSQPSPTTVLVICHKHKTIDGRTNFAKAVKKNGLLFNSKKLYDNQIVPWIEKYLGEKGYTIQPKAAFMIKESVGDQLSKLSNELDKLMLNLPKGSSIVEKMVEENVGLSKDYNVFELTNALGKKDVLKVNRICSIFGKNQKTYPLPMILPVLYRFFSQLLLVHAHQRSADRELAAKVGLHPFFVKDYRKAAANYPVKKISAIISSLRSADGYSKGVGSTSMNSNAIFQELMFEILH